MLTDDSFREIGEHALLKATCALNIDRLSPFPAQLWKCWDRVPRVCNFWNLMLKSQNGDSTCVANFIERQRRLATTWQNAIFLQKRKTSHVSLQCFAQMSGPRKAEGRSPALWGRIQEGAGRPLALHQIKHPVI